MGDFDGLVAAVTGGASGIGAAVATELAAQGARVAVLDLQPPDGSQHAVALRTDVTDDASVRAAVEQILAELGRLDVLVNNAGIGAQGTVEDNDDAEWLRVLDVNLLGMVRTSRAALPALRRSPSAAIVNTGSIAATAGLPQRVLYSATKGAVLALTRAMAADHLA
ncbi:MAG: SDR family NAD(P)-dependent oxidoreductase, partial [Solirubrobacteraceae bacterium]